MGNQGIGLFNAISETFLAHYFCLLSVSIVS